MIEKRYLEQVLSNEIIDEVATINFSLTAYIVKACKLYGYFDSEIKLILLGTNLMDIGLQLDYNSSIDYNEHPIKGLMFLSSFDNVEIVKNIILMHHENCIGTGFPFGVKGNEIPEYVKIVTTCRDFLILQNEKKLSYEEIIEHLCLFNDKMMVEKLSCFVFTE